MKDEKKFEGEVVSLWERISAIKNDGLFSGCAEHTGNETKWGQEQDELGWIKTEAKFVKAIEGIYAGCSIFPEYDYAWIKVVQNVLGHI